MPKKHRELQNSKLSNLMHTKFPHLTRAEANEAAVDLENIIVDHLEKGDTLAFVKPSDEKTWDVTVYTLDGARIERHIPRSKKK